ncbi:MAG: hypothetical protein WD060_03120 [Pirellulales bacterium]
MAMTPAMGGRHVPRGGPRLRAPLAVDTLPSVVALPLLAAVLIGGTAVACGTVLAVRRLSGGFGVAESAVAWLVTAAGIALVSVADQSSRHGVGVFGPVAARCGLILGVVSVALPPRAGDWASILAVMTAAAVAVVRIPRKAAPRPSAAAPRHPAAPSHPRRPPRGRAVRVRRDDHVPGRLLQRLERFESPSGADCLRGRLHLSLPAGSRAAHAHVGFCPSFAETPSVRVTTEYDGVEAVVSAAEVLPWGVRVECRLTEPAEEPLEIPVDVFVQAPR